MERLRELRKEKNLAQKKVADAVGISQQTLSRYEKNISIVPVDALIRLARYYNVTTDYLLEVSQIKNERKSLSDKKKKQEFFSVYKTLSRKNKELLWAIAIKMRELDEE